MKKINKILLLFISLVIIIFRLWYGTRIIYDLKETNINEKIVLTIKWKEWNFLLNLNTYEIKSFTWNYIELNNTKLDIYTKIYSPNWKFYFKIFWVYDYLDNLLNETWLCPIDKCKFFWTKDSKYLIRMDWRVVRMFWLFFSTPTIQQVIHIIEPETKKSKQILLYDENWKLIEVDEIKWYTE